VGNRPIYKITYEECKKMQVFQDALKQYARRKDKNLRTLMKYASMFHVEKILRPYLEVLL
jgi:hypothetical protein